MVNTKDLIKKYHDQRLIDNGYKRSSSQAGKREGGPASEQAADKLHAENSARFVESAQAQLGRKPKKIR